MRRPSQSDLKAYGISILSVAAAAALTSAIEPIFHGKAPMVFFVGAVLWAAVRGIGPGLVATVLGTLSASLLFPQMSLVMAQSSLGILFAVGISISIVMGRMHHLNVEMSQAKRALEEAHQKLLERSQSLADSNAELQRFAYTVAHDLNNPVRSIGALTELLLQRNRDRLDASSQECAGLIVNKAQRMQAMIKGLLDCAAAVEKPAGGQSVDSAAAVHKTLQDLDSVIRARGAQIAQEPLPFVNGAESQLVLVFSNLIGNAIKYCPAERVPEIHISAAEQGEQHLFAVRDNGPGIDPAYSDEVFGMFKRLHGDEYEGSGIGLALCKAVIERHGGRIWFESQPGQGATFFFTLPK